MRLVQRESDAHLNINTITGKNEQTFLPGVRETEDNLEHANIEMVVRIALDKSQVAYVDMLYERQIYDWGILRAVLCVETRIDVIYEGDGSFYSSQ